jgi:hypothetical protein
MEWEVKQLLPVITTYTIFLQYMFNPLNIELHQKVEAIPKVRDLWLPTTILSPHWGMRFFFIRIDKLFIIMDKVIRIEHKRVEFKALVWRLGRF